MKPIHYVILTIAGIILLLAIMNWDKIKKMFTPETPDSESDFDKCLKKNKSMADGEPCTNCLPEGSTQPVYAGVIENGVCERIVSANSQSFNKIKIVKLGGASTFMTDAAGNIVPSTTPDSIPEGTILTVTQYVTAPRIYYNTPSGWIDGNDAIKIIT